MLDERTEFGQRAARRLREEHLGWLTTVSPSGQPQPVLVWFLWDGDSSVLIYSRPDQPKLRNIGEDPRVSLHLDGDGLGEMPSSASVRLASRTTRLPTGCPITSRSTGG